MQKKTKEVFISFYRSLLWLARGKILTPPDKEKVRYFLKHCIAHYEVLRKIRTDPVTVFVREAFVLFCNQIGIRHVKCPVRDHRGNGKTEKLMRTINERLRANRQVILSKNKSGLWEILCSLRVSKKREGTSPFEKHMGKEPLTVKSNVVKGLWTFQNKTHSWSSTPQISRTNWTLPSW